MVALQLRQLSAYLTISISLKTGPKLKVEFSFHLSVDYASVH